MAKWDVIIIGAGMSGLCSGALLANGGKKVLLLEKQPYTEGRKHSGMINGVVVENGAHEPSQAGHLEDIFSRLGKPYPTGKNFRHTEINRNGQWSRLLSGVDRKQLGDILTEISSLSYDEIANFENISIKDWVSKRTNNQTIHDMFFILGLGVLVANHYEDMSAGEELLHFKEHLERWGDIRNTVLKIDGGTSKLTETLIEVIKENGGEIRTNTPVNDIIVENGKVCGVEIEVGERIIAAQIREIETIEAPVVICTVPPWDLFEVISEDRFPHWYVEWVKRLRYKFSIVSGFTLGVKKLLWDFDTMRWYIPKLPRSKMAMGSYWETESVLQIYFQCHWNEVPNMFEMDEAINRRKLREIMTLFEEDVYEIVPDLKENIEWKVAYSTVFSVAAAPGQVGGNRPSMNTPIENLYLVSDTIRESRGMGLQAVAHSATICADKILGIK